MLNCDEIKRKLRELKRLEAKLYMNDIEAQKNRMESVKGPHSAEPVWNRFFDLKDECSKNVRYSINRLLLMNKEEFKDVIEEYLYHVYYQYYIANEASDNSIIEPEILTQLELSLNSDINDAKRKLRELLKTYHPDNGGDSSKFIEIMEKYKSLKD